MRPIKHNLIMDTFKGVDPLDFITITDKEGNSLDPETEKKTREILSKYWEHPKLKELFDRMLLNWVAYGDTTCNWSEVDKVLQEITKEEV